MTEEFKKSHNKNLFLYHLVCPAKYRKKIFTKSVEKTLVEVCQKISDSYEIYFVEIGSDIDHVHFLIQSIPMMLPTMVVRITKSITAREILKKHSEIKQILWGGKFWTRGYYICTVGKRGNEEVISKYVKNQGKSYRQIYRRQLTLFDGIL